MNASRLAETPGELARKFRRLRKTVGAEALPLPAASAQFYDDRQLHVDLTVDDRLRLAAEIAEEEAAEAEQEQREDFNVELETNARKAGELWAKARFRHQLIRSLLNHDAVVDAIEEDTKHERPMSASCTNLSNVDLSSVVSSDIPSTPRSQSNFDRDSIFAGSTHTLSTLGEEPEPDLDSWEFTDAVVFNVNTDAPWYQQFAAAAQAWLIAVVEDFTETREDSRSQWKQQPVSIKRLRKNLQRCLDSGRPYLEFCNGIVEIILWHRPFSTLIMFAGFMHAVYKGWLMSYLWLLLICQLSLNYLAYRGYSFGINLFPRTELSQELLPVDIMKMSQGTALVMLVVQLAQILLAFIADVLEKLKHLFLWKRPQITARFYGFIWICFIASLLVSTSIQLTLLGLAIGFNVFVTTFLFYRFPRVRRRFDIIYRMFISLPVDHEHRLSQREQNQKRQRAASTSKKASNIGSRSSRPSFVEASSNHMSSVGMVAALGGVVPQGLVPRFVKHCLLIDREKTFPTNIGSGVLCFLDHHISFKYRRKSNGVHDIVSIPFSDILAVSKAKTTSFLAGSWLPGVYAGLEIFVSGRSKSYVFAGLSKQDHALDILCELGQSTSCQWAFRQT